MAFGDRKKNKADAEEKKHSLADAAVDAASVDLAPSTAAIEIVPEVTATREPSTDTGPISRRSNYTRRDQLRGDVFDQPEPAAMLTADRLIDVSPRNRQAPEGGLRKFLYYASLKTLNLGDSRKVRERKALDARIGAMFDGERSLFQCLPERAALVKPP